MLLDGTEETMGQTAEYNRAESRLRRIAEEAGVSVDDVLPPSEEIPFSLVVEVPGSMAPEKLEAFRRACAVVLDQDIPKSANRWAWCILVFRSSQPAGTYFGGWAGHENRWQEDDPRDSDQLELIEWEQLYDRILACLVSRGRNDPHGDGDFWLLDDDYGCFMQRVCIFRIEVLTANLIDDLRKILSVGFPRWSIQVVLELLPPDEDVSREGVEIFADRVVEHWDRVALRARFGGRFKALR